MRILIGLACLVIILGSPLGPLFIAGCSFLLFIVSILYILRIIF